MRIKDNRKNKSCNGLTTDYLNSGECFEFTAGEYAGNFLILTDEDGQAVRLDDGYLVVDDNMDEREVKRVNAKIVVSD